MSLRDREALEPGYDAVVVVGDGDDHAASLADAADEQALNRQGRKRIPRQEIEPPRRRENQVIEYQEHGGKAV